MHRITIIAIVVAAVVAAVGIMATSAVYFYPNVTPRMGASPENNQRELITGELPPSSNASNNKGYRQVNLTVNGIELIADVAATNEQRTKGLSVKDALAENQAMLFVFGTPGDHSFWMKNMKFPIDIMWLDSNKTVIHIEQSLQPCSWDDFCPTYKPDNDNSLYVLETVAGFAEKHQIAEGTRVEFKLNF